MGQRNMQYPNHMIDMEADQRSFHPDPCIFYGGITNFPHPGMHAAVPAPGSSSSLNVHHLQEHHESALFYGMTHYGGVQHQHPVPNLDIAVAAPSNQYHPYMGHPSASRDFPVPVNHGAHDQLSFSSSNRIVGIPQDSYGRNNPYMESFRGSFKRKNSEGIPGNFQYCSALPGASSSVTPMSARPLDSDVAMVDAAPFGAPEYGGNDVPSLIENGSQRSVRNRSGILGADQVLAHNNHLVQGNYVSQPFPLPGGSPWLDLSAVGGVGEFDTSAWNQAPNIAYVHGSINGGCAEAGHMVLQGYQLPASSRASSGFPHPVVPHGHPVVHHPLQHMQATRGPNINFPSQVVSSSRRLPSSSLNLNVYPSQGILEAGPRYLGPVPPTGYRLFRPHRRELMPEGSSRHRTVPHLRVLPEDGVAMLEIPGYHEVGDSVDQHRDMRLDIDHMSYEELLELGEQIGSVGTGLSDETITSHLKTRSFVPMTPCSMEDTTSAVDEEIDSCVVCQTEYKDGEKIGTLNCGHEYHVDCIKKWLLVKNTCPVCKSTGLTIGRKDS